MVKKILKSYDYTLVIAMFLLSAFGLVMVYSASMAYAVQRYNVPSDFFYQRQKIFMLISLVIFIIAAIVPYKIMKFTKFFLAPLVIFSILSLVGLFFFGNVAGNAESWYQIGPLKLQPAEFVKLCVIIYLSAVYAKKQSYINQFNTGVLPPLIYLIIVCALIIKQPDFGTAVIIVLIAGTIIISSGMNYKTMTKLVVFGLLLSLPLFFVMKGKLLTSKQMDRIAVIKDPFATEQHEGFHLANSYIAIGNGGVHGLGLGKSVQKLGYLPESHTDFIMAVIAEELGIWGVAFVIVLLAYIVLRGIYIGLQCKDPFGSLLAIGISSMIGIQSFINLGGVSGFIPLTGVPLPFISYGGSSLLMLAVAMGILVNVSMFVKYEKKYKGNKEQKVQKGVGRKGKVTYI
jgi:cell division protein FtsW